MLKSHPDEDDPPRVSQTQHAKETLWWASVSWEDARSWANSRLLPAVSVYSGTNPRTPRSEESTKVGLESEVNRNPERSGSDPFTIPFAQPT